MRVHCGTSGFAYKEWKGSFYPADLPDSQMLAFYGSRLSAVEINNSFYRLPSTEVVAAWCKQVPEAFRFSLKASRRITHQARLANCEEPTRFMLAAHAELGERQGPLLFQLPPTFKQDCPRLERFLEGLPPGSRHAFEFRNDSWFNEDVFNVLEKHGAALVAVDGAAQPPAWRSIARWGYVRMRAESYDDDRLREWKARMENWGWTDAFVYFKHEGLDGPHLAARFTSI